MFGFLGFLLIIFLLIVFIGFTILGNILRVLFGIGKHPPYQNRTSTHQKQNTYTQTQTNDENENFAEFSSSSSNKNYRFFLKKSFINRAHSSASIPFTTIVFGCKASGAYF